MQRMLVLLAGTLAGLGLSAPIAQAARIRVDLSSQTMHVSSGAGDYDWPISSARSGFTTPRGSYGVQRLEAMHYSRKYHNSPMPHSIFFRGGYAIHGTYATASLGAPASHGCIRIAPENAALLYDIVRSEGARISITGAPAVVVSASADRGVLDRGGRVRGGFGWGGGAYGADGQPLGGRVAGSSGARASSLGDWLGVPAAFGLGGDDDD